MAKNTAKNEELVEITLFRDGEKYKDDVYVCVNGEGCLIRRGEPVRAPLYRGSTRKFCPTGSPRRSHDGRAHRRLNPERRGSNV